MSFEPDVSVILVLLVAGGAVWLLRQRATRRRIVQAPSRDSRDAIVQYLQSHFDR
jgi:hypothetical protein